MRISRDTQFKLFDAVDGAVALNEGYDPTHPNELKIHSLPKEDMEENIAAVTVGLRH